MRVEKSIDFINKYLRLEEAQQFHSFRQQFIALTVQRAFESEFSDPLHDILFDAVARTDQPLVRLVLH